MLFFRPPGGGGTIIGTALDGPPIAADADSTPAFNEELGYVFMLRRDWTPPPFVILDDLELCGGGGGGGGTSPPLPLVVPFTVWSKMIYVYTC
jgi:hypothetical protein